MTLSPGTRLGPYAIDSLIGAGGMGQVYKARDTRLDRTVALKLLPADLAERADRRRRFETEARAISSLSHPHICALFDIGEIDGRAFLVMEYVEGETLEDRLARGPLLSSDVLRYGVQIADALDHAHRAHIVHRDLKPSNVMLTASGPKLLDFGLAKRADAEGGAGLTTASIGERPLTAEGAVIGTLQYMSPEQLEGRPVDARTDIFALGVLLYEMATGRKAFTGDSQASLIAAILTSHPPTPSSLSSERARFPLALDHVVERCLAKKAAERWQSAGDVKLELDWIARSGTDRVATRTRPSRRLLWASVALLAILSTAIAAVLVMNRQSPLELLRFTVEPPQGSILAIAENRGVLAVSPDGRHLAFVASTNGVQRLWVHSFEHATARMLEGTDGATSPFWSPDSRFIGFHVAAKDGELRKVERDGGPPRTICAARSELVPTWADDGTILFTQFRQGIFRVAGEGGEATPVTRLNESRREQSHYSPSMLPDGRHFLYTATALDENGTKVTPTVYVGSLDGGEATAVAQMHSRMVYVDPGYVLFVQDGALFAQRFDVSRLRLIGEPTRIVDALFYVRSIANAHFSVSANGVLAYQGPSPSTQLVWYDRSGRSTVSRWPPQVYGLMRLSPAGDRFAVDVTDTRLGSSNILIYDVNGTAAIRATDDVNNENDAGWSGDGRRLVFRSDRSGPPRLFAKTIGGNDERLTDMSTGPSPQVPNDWSRNGKWIVYIENTLATRRNLMLLPMEGDRKPRPFAATAADEYDAAFSPDGSQIAFVSDESGQPEIYVAPILQSGDKRPVSSGGGTTPRWRSNGRELFYASAGNRSIVAVAVNPGATSTFGEPRELFRLALDGASRPTVRNTAYDVTPDGQRFLVSVPVGEPTSSRLSVVKNWTSLLKE